MGFAENVKSELDFQNMQLKTGISRNTLDKYLTGKKVVQPGVENAVKIAQALGVSVEYLVTGKSENPNRLTSEYEQLLRKYQKLNNFNRRTVFDLVNSISVRQEDLQKVNDQVYYADIFDFQNLECYTRVIKWDNGYIVVMAKNKSKLEHEDYIDLEPILNNLYMDSKKFLSKIKSVEIKYD